MRFDPIYSLTRRADKIVKTKLLALVVVGAGVISTATLLRSNLEAPLGKAVPAQSPSPTIIEGNTKVSATDGSASAAAEDFDSPETEIVMGLQVLKDRNCTVTRHYIDLGNGMVTEAYSCVPDEKTPNPYELLSDDELAVLAYSDPQAASMLGKRMVESDPARSRELLIRAVALEPTNLEPVMWLAAVAYSLRGHSKAAKDATANAYVITLTARALGSDSDVGPIIEDLRDAGLTDEGFAALDEAVKDDLSAIRKIQLEVFGKSAIGEELL
jgi:hypothetical protein